MDRRPIEDWQLNASSAVITLDTPWLFSEHGGDDALAPSYAASLTSVADPGDRLPSVNLIDGKAKQVDDGLYAALDRAYYAGDPALGLSVVGHRNWLVRLGLAVPTDSPASDYLLAGLSLGAGDLPRPLTRRARRLADDFRAVEVNARPTGFYTWTPELTDCFRVLRYFSRPIAEPGVVADLARTIRTTPGLIDPYRRALGFSARLTNPLRASSVLDFAAEPARRPGPNEWVALFPPSNSREAELFERIFRDGLPPNAQLMRALVEAIRSGRVDLAPGAEGGWYAHQAFALEPLLLPERGEGADHLLLTRNYKKRALVAFEALLTKRHETHARQLAGAKAADAPPELPRDPIAPRLRVEPNPGYYLWTARAYAFVLGVLEANCGASALDAIHGLTANGPRPDPLGREIRATGDLFLGLALLSSEDIGHTLDLRPDEQARREAAEAAATAWLDRIARDPNADPDLRTDTRVVVPIAHEPTTGRVRCWATIGVGSTTLLASYVRPPQIRPSSGGDWQPVLNDRLGSAFQQIAVDEFAEFELPAGRVLDRAELRAICDRHRTRNAIRETLKAIR